MPDPLHTALEPHAADPAYAAAAVALGATAGDPARAARLVPDVPRAALDTLAPHAAAHPAAFEASRISAWHERRLARDARARHAAGAFYTPRALALDLARRALATAARPPRTVLDPACGTGALLDAALDALRDAAPDLDIGAALDGFVGVDNDPVAAAIARARAAARAGRPAGTVLVADALAPDLGARLGRAGAPARFDLVIGNPPFGNAIRRGTARNDAQRADYAARFPRAAHGAYDRAALFVELGLRSLSDEGRLAVLVPRALLAAPWADQLRRWSTDTFGLRDLDVTDDRELFEHAQIHVAALVLGGDPGASPVPLVGYADRWAVATSPDVAALADLPAHAVPLGELLDISASATTGEAYDLKPHVRDGEPVDGFRLVTSGAIDPGVIHWGTRTQRYLGDDYLTPWIPRHVVPPRRAEQWSRPRILLPGLSKNLEAAVVPDGDWAGAVATVQCVPRGAWHGVSLDRIADLLNSEPVRAQYRALWGALALSGGNMAVSRKKLAEVRVDPDAVR